MKQSKEHTPRTQGPRGHHELVALPLIVGPKRDAKPRSKGPDDLRTFDEARARLGMSPKTLRAHMRDGSIRYITIGQGTKRQTYRFAPADLADFIEKQAQQEAAPCPSTKTRARRTTSTNFNSKVIAIADRLRSGANAKRKP